MQRNYLILVVLCVGICLFGGLSTTAVAAPTAPSSELYLQTGPYATAKGAVNVRGGPGIGFYITDTLYANEVVPILAVSPDGGWWYISTPDTGEGWVSNVAVMASNAVGIPVRDPGIVGTANGIVNVRDGAGPEAIRLGQLTQGDQVYVLGRNADGTWLQIQWAYGVGWVSAELLIANGVPGVVAAGSAPVTAGAPYGIVMAEYLNVRTGPGPNYAVLGQIYGGDTVAIVGENQDGSWYQVETVYGTGWVYGFYLTTRNEYGTLPETTDTATGAAITGPIGIVNAGALNIRTGPGAQYTSIGTLPGGAEVRVVGRSADWSWWLLETSFGTGWASDQYVVVRGDITNVPYVEPGGVVPPSESPGGEVAPPPAQTGPIAFIASGALNIRSGPSVAFSPLGSVYGGTRLPIIGQSADGGWWLVQSDFGNGWVSKGYVIPEGNTANVPVVQ